ncbi:hypothetical protein QAD02_014354 [Eretmocerus hayati]|uniref:Uncharacterized protein n=1 Tax=Eretmocerus hayati TaxID=131215 RepID=A0ACC2P7X5_9HYME|nr:hypothetical protein QAD02_014354 [Eretmocerus hayati]
MLYEQRLNELEDERLVKMWYRESVEIEYCNVEKERFWHDLGWSSEVINQNIQNGFNLYPELVKRLNEVEDQKIVTKLSDSKYNPRYKEISCQNELPKYLASYRPGVDIGIVARLRGGNFDLSNKYWMEKGGKVCILCEDMTICNLEHLLCKCAKTGEYVENLNRNGANAGCDWYMMCADMGVTTALKRIDEAWKRIESRMIERE